MARPDRTPGGSRTQRRIIAILLVMAAVGVGVGWLARRGDAPRAAAGEAEARGDGRGGRDLGASAGPLARRRGPSAADVLGALGRHAGNSDLLAVEGRVIDAISRQPIGDVEVVFTGAAGEATATADGDGEYRIDLPAGEYRAFVRGEHVISVGASAPERLPTPPDPMTVAAPDDAVAAVIRLAASQRGVDLEVQRSGVVLGRVVDPQGRPVVGAVVRAEVGMWKPVMGTHVAESGADGEFRLEVPAGYFGLTAAHPDFAGVRADDHRQSEVMVYPQMETTVELTLARGCVVTGRAVRRDGSPAEGALERATGADFYPAGTLAADGSFRWTTVAEEEVTLRAWPWKAAPAPAQTVRCADGVRHVLEFVIPDATADLAGRIVDADGNPVAGAYLDIYGLSEGTMNQQERADAGGDWAVYALPAGEYAVSAYVPGLGVASARLTAPGSGHTLTLSGTGTLAGTVLGLADGETFQLQLHGCSTAHGGAQMPPTTRLVPVSGGRFRVEDLPACRLVAQARTATRTRVLEVQIEPGTTTDTEIDLAPPRAKTVKISVVDDGGDAVANATVYVYADDPRRPPSDGVATDARGEATVDAYVGDVISVVVTDAMADSAASIGHHRVTDAAGATEEATIRLEPLGP